MSMRRRGHVSAAVPDERFARRLLSDHLTMRGVSEFQCTVIEDDPPDLVVTWKNGAQWGVEVTRTYQRVASFDGEKSVSSEGIVAPLLNFAKRLGEKTTDIRKCGYTLSLEGPGRFSSWESQVSREKWEEKTEKAIRKHIISEDSSILRVPGVWLKPSRLEEHPRPISSIPGAPLQPRFELGASFRKLPIAVETLDLGRVFPVGLAALSVLGETAPP